MNIEKLQKQIITDLGKDHAWYYAIAETDDDLILTQGWVFYIVSQKDFFVDLRKLQAKQEILGYLEEEKFSEKATLTGKYKKLHTRDKMIWAEVESEGGDMSCYINNDALAYFKNPNLKIGKYYLRNPETENQELYLITYVFEIIEEKSKLTAMILPLKDEREE